MQYSSLGGLGLGDRGELNLALPQPRLNRVRNRPANRRTGALLGRLIFYVCNAPTRSPIAAKSLLTYDDADIHMTFLSIF